MESLAPLAFIYKPLYMIVVFLMTFNKFGVMNRYSADAVVQKRDNYGSVILFMVFFVLFYGLRPTVGVGQYFVDTGNYAKTYELIQQYGVFNMQGDDEAGGDNMYSLLCFNDL